MAVIRDADKVRHTISDFVFGDLDGHNRDEDRGFTPLFKNESELPKREPRIIEQHSTKTEKREELEKRDKMIEALLEKSDSLSGELAKVQAKLTNQESLFRDEMNRIKDDAFNRGIQEGLSQAKMSQDAQYGEKIHQLQESIDKLEVLSSQFSSMMQSVEKELVHTSIAIAKEVIDAEITYNSGQVAINLSKSLIKKIEDAKEIKIRVNRLDYESVKVGLSELKHIEVIPDSAIARGGVIVISDIGSIEGNIMERYKKVRDDAISKI